MKDRYLLAGSLVIIFLSGFVIFRLPHLSTRPTVLSQTIDILPEQPEFKPIYDTVIKHGLADVKALALTFDADAGFGIKKSEQRREFLYQEKIVEILTEENIPATIFVTGQWAKNHEEILKDLSRNYLFEIGNHSFSHPAFSKACTNLQSIEEGQHESEFLLSQAAIADVIGYLPRLFRFPGGCFTPKDLEIAKGFGLTVVHWDTDPQDAYGKSKEALIASLKEQIHPGAIILLHLNGGEIDSDVAGALPEIISYANQNGYTFVKVGEMLSQMEKAIAVN